MIDIHSHILPFTDDGAKDLDESMAMGRQEAEGGTTVVFATPHVYNAGDLQKTPGFVQKVIDLQAEFDRDGIKIQLIQGAEVFPMMEILDALKADLPVTLGGKKKHILLDLPLGQWPMDLNNLTFELLANGVTPILAHPERTAPIQESLERLIPYLERGVLIQVNAGSLSGRYGPQAQKRAHQIISRTWAQFLATDMHHPSPNGAALKRAKDALSDSSPSYIEEITVRNPGCVLAGKSVPSINYEILDAPPEKKRLFGIFPKRR